MKPVPSPVPGNWIFTLDEASLSQKEGMVLGSTERTVTCYFPSKGIRTIMKAEAFLKTSEFNTLPLFFQKPKPFNPPEVKIPVRWAAENGFRPLTHGFWEFSPTASIRTPNWDRGSVWKVVESSTGERFLVREGDTGEPPNRNNPIENDDMAMSSPSQDNSIFPDAAESSSSKTYARKNTGNKFPITDELERNGNLATEEDWTGGISTFAGDGARVGYVSHNERVLNQS